MVVMIPNTRKTEIPIWSETSEAISTVAPSLLTIGGARSVHPERSILDKFANTYVPNWLQTIPKALYDVPLPPLPLPIDPAQAAQIFPLPLLETVYPPMQTPGGLEWIAPPPLDAYIPQLKDDTSDYCDHFTNLLAMEQAELRSAAGKQIMYGVQIDRQATKSRRGPASAGVIWQLLIPGTREDSPRLFIDDRLSIRGLYRSLQTATEAGVQARITGTIKREGMVFFECPALESMEHMLRHSPHTNGRVEYIVEFYPSSDALVTMHNARQCSNHASATFYTCYPLRTTRLHVNYQLQRVSSCLESLAGMERRTPTKKWLFPNVQDVSETLSYENYEVRRYPKRKGIESAAVAPLNEQQHLAIERVVGSRRSIPYLIVGPPGTGKTKTMVELVLQILAHHDDAHILVTAPSNPAADTLALRLTAYLDNKTMLRLQSSTRTFAETPNEVLTYSYIQNDTFAVPPWESLLQYKVVVVNCLDAELLAMAKATNAEMLRLERRTMVALRGKRAKATLVPHWTHLLVDEAGQASEPELLIPISTVAIGTEESDYIEGATPQIVICGDVKQLPAIITSSRARDHALDVSFMERLQERSVYNIKANEQNESASIIRLVKNYRSHPGILLLPSTIFYDDALEPVANVPLSHWRGLPNERLPMLIHGIEANEDWIDEGASYFNTAEILQVVRTVKSLVTGRVDGYRQSEIGIITPWREQVWRLRLKLREAGYHDINVGNVEAYQGAEYRCVILSCVRSRSRFVSSDRQNGMGLITEPKRFNVAITRAKELMIIIGNMNCHRVDTHWQALLQIASRHKCYTGPPLRNFELTGDYISRLESRVYQPIYTDRNDLSMEGLLISGAVAREALIEE